ncbi:MAG: tetratricopeptide repeat protein, partial [Aureliella sp.]
MAAKRLAPAAPARRWRYVVLTAVLLAALLVGVLTVFTPVPNSDELDPQLAELALAQAHLALRNNAFEQAEKLAAAVPPKSPWFVQSRLLAGEAATRNHRLETALKYYSEIAKGSSREAITSAYAMAEIYRAQCQLEPACAYYSRVLAREPNHVEAHERMAFLLGVTRQNWEAAPHYLALVKLESWTLDSLAILADIERSIEQPAFVKECAEKAPEDPLSQLALAGEKVYDGETEEAKPLLAKVVAERPGLLAAQGMLGELLLTDGPEAFESWNRNLPPAAAEHSDIWFVRGLQSRRDQQLELAAGCFALAVKLAPEHR